MGDCLVSHAGQGMSILPLQSLERVERHSQLFTLHQKPLEISKNSMNEHQKQSLPPSMKDEESMLQDNSPSANVGGTGEGFLDWPSS